MSEGGANQVLLSSSVGPSTVAHEILNALGFTHEHQRPDRDQ